MSSCRSEEIEQNGRAFPAEQGELFVEVHSGADIDACCRFAEYVNLARPAERPRENELLLVTTGEFLGELRRQPRPDIEHRRDLFDKIGEAPLSQEPAAERLRPRERARASCSRRRSD